MALSTRGRAIQLVLMLQAWKKISRATAYRLLSCLGALPKESVHGTP